jgi:hypothetical protein
VVNLKVLLDVGNRRVVQADHDKINRRGKVLNLFREPADLVAVWKQ